ncbi:MAG: MetQ/NlpA family ABC transporter substrate-binding protein [bacterium]|nr:MetQ/NlpA family ABC transporter substrate-binding protein [bacterium]
MKRKLTAIILTVGIVAGSLVGCGSSSSNDKTIKIGASVTPHSEILNGVVKQQLEKDGYTLEVVEYNDYVLPNTALSTGELDANYFQHQPYLDDFNTENKTNLVSVAKVHFEPFGLYAGKSSDLKTLKEGATVAVPNDTTNEARALLLLEAQGLIKLDSNAGLKATVVDIKENPLNLKIKEIEAAQIARSLQDVDIACINGNYAISGGLKVSDALAVEAADSEAAKTYANIVVVKAGNENTEKTKALVKAITSEEVKKYIEENYKGAVVPVF